MTEKLFEYVLVHTWNEKKQEFNEVLETGQLFAKDAETVKLNVMRDDIALDYEVNELTVLVRPF